MRFKEFFNTKPANSQQIHSLDSGVSVSEITSASWDSDSGTSIEDINSSELHRTGFRGKSNFVPFKNRNASMDAYCRLVESDVVSIFKLKRQYKLAHNLTNAQLLELESLKKDLSIVIQSADKGWSSGDFRSKRLRI